MCALIIFRLSKFNFYKPFFIISFNRLIIINVSDIIKASLFFNVNDKERTMADMDNTKASTAAVKDAQNMWENFTKISMICGVVSAVVLILMAITLV